MKVVEGGSDGMKGLVVQVYCRAVDCEVWRVDCGLSWKSPSVDDMIEIGVKSRVVQSGTGFYTLHQASSKTARYGPPDDRRPLATAIARSCP